jgi:outer membrane protein OmpA-like peptidoglycan-associated protein
VVQRVSITGLLIFLLAATAALAQSDQQRVNLGPAINSEYSELQPIITSDEQVLFFTRKGHPGNVGIATRPDDEDIWYSVRMPDGTWSEAIHLEGPLNTQGYDGVRDVNSTFTRLYLQNRYNPDGTRGKGFSVSERAADGTWQYPVPLDIENYYNDTTIATLSVSHDENVLIISLKRKDSRGGHDLYVSFKTGPYTYSEPKNIPTLSTEGDEIAPFIGFDDHTMYLPTTGWGAEGNTHDIFLTRRLDDTWLNWSTPEKLPFPINTPSADFYINLSAQADTCYLSSWHETTTRGHGRSDIWKFAMPRSMRPGVFTEKGDGKPSSPLQPTTIISTEPTGPAVGSLIRLEDVYFDTDQATLRPNSKESLDKLLALLKQYPTMRIEIQGHTDSDGSEDHNMELSSDRAKAVRQYLIDGGIQPGRLTSQGYGEHVPIAPNTTQQGKQLNRRSMILVKGYDFAG